MKKKLTDSYRIILGNYPGIESLISEIKDKYQIADFDQTIIDAETISVSQLQTELESFPILSEKRLVVIRNIESFNKDVWEKILTYLKKPYPHLYLFLIGPASRSLYQKLRPYGAEITSDKKSQKGEIFSEVYGRYLNTDKIIRLFHEFLKQEEKAFPVLLSAGEIYLRNHLGSDKKKISEFKDKLHRLHELDFSLKVGRLSPSVGLELFLAYLFD